MKTSLIVACALVASLLGPLANAGEDAQLLEARKVATMLPPRLLAALQEEIGRSGPAGAIPVCKDMAPKMAVEISAQTGWKIRRVSLKTRNDARAVPDAWERAALEDFDRRAAAGEPPAQLERGEMVDNEYRYVKALPTQPLCLSCHGPVDQLAPGVRSVLGQLYPDDLATGYSVGQIRGAISVRRSI
ncbi:MAG: DUF3365 domain-containing protein [Gammaproteobacteria bacterium]|jgi:hypothetical protein|nr:DUF3365 domain-containing protein [Gammaproteobacteria bacterium]MBP6053910.1 DUF3365 domain-containing protein [Pseudomonadales bacterium]MBK6583126.1 DUF3365 domain-containing protein [Gammaproteobacteria bacterium]MBK7519260.1 DUF3365 domain-containing protein [Gammaproteobacteria bacterium]MBK7730002.1 DUF3365 domain-containing protein [Gammaproteobacteria bacterium]